MSLLAQVSKPRRDSAETRLFRWSFDQIGVHVALIDAALIFSASILADWGYRYFWLGVSPDAEIGAGVGIVACAVFLFVGRSLGLYSLPALLAPQTRFSSVIISWAA